MKNFLISLLMLAVFTLPSQAGEGLLNKMLSPGPLMLGHQDLGQTDCLKCHELNKGVPDAKCLDCHKEIRKSVETKRGFHGRMTQVCIKCHSDHKGKNFDTTKIDPTNFDHSKTGYVLKGKHEKLHCHECHKENRSKMAVRKGDLHYLAGLATSCSSCHQKDDPHHFDGKWASKDCDSCHSMNTWKKEIRFDHDKDTSYALEGKHQQVKCLDCHKNKETKTFKYEFHELKGKQCLSCHKDQHANRFSPKYQNGDCLKCHKMEGWKIEQFDHGITGYELKGKHAKINCIDCHKQPAGQPQKAEQKDLFYKGLKKDCLSCHKNYHQFSTEPGRKLGDLRNCTACHTETNWKTNFDHNTDTRYEIGGKHVGVKCEKCHTVDPKDSRFRIYKWQQLQEKTCEVCHKSPHLKSFSKENLAKKCTDCHVDTGWEKNRNSKFNHDKSTRFPLEGRHKEISCTSCHVVNKNKTFRFPSFEKKFCVDCHTNPHKGQFSDRVSQAECAKCHDSESWTRRLPFDHKSTRFDLTGKHKGLKCEECHKPTAETFEVKPHHAKSKYLFGHAEIGFCSDCHENVHRNQFHPKFNNGDCLHCHDTESFKKRQPFRHEETSFPLRGKHLEVRCDKCHVPTKDLFPKSNHAMRKFVFEVAPENCSGCHKDPHKGTYGARCSECHNEEAWKRTGDFHKNFTLTGVHFSLSCAECHKDSRRLAGMSRECILCHQKDDIHSGTLPKCEECHRQTFWEHTSFNHGLTLFALRGIHRTLDCMACHSTGVYKGLPNTCANCHQQQALAFTGNPKHSLLLGRSCSDCHNQFSFQ
jgi:hypothetical protein